MAARMTQVKLPRKRIVEVMVLNHACTVRKRMVLQAVANT
jgi:hypothetical protein